jgi:hypothetical protein
MLINKPVKISTKGCRKIEYFESLGYDVSGDFFEIKIEDLNIGSTMIVDVECDYCKKILQTSYKKYLNNVQKGGKYACSKICGSLKAKETCKEKYGVENAMILKETQEKTKKTNREKYGVDFLMQSSEIQEKSKKTLIEKWGVDHISKTEDFKEKFKETMLERWGVEYSMQSDIIREKSKKTNLKKLGVENPSQSEEIKKKISKTNLERWGNDNYLKSEDYKSKSKKTLMTKWGSDNIMKSELFRSDKFSITKDENYIKYGFSGVSIMECEKDHLFEIHIDNYLKRSKSNLPLCTVCHPIGDSQSIKEKELFEFIKSIYSGEIIQSYRDGLEIDIYLPELKLGFEFNGLYWHSEIYKDKMYHLNKSNYFKEKEIRIIHIWEDDWTLKRDIVESQIRNWLVLNGNKIFARNCQIREIKDIKIIKGFLNKNHIQGWVNSKIKIGLFFNSELVSLMTFDQFEGRKKMGENGWNLNRFCNKLNHSVVGGASKLLNYFIRVYKPNRIVSYADRDWSSGDLYEILGFDKVYQTDPDYKYLFKGVRIHKSRFRKSFTKISESVLDIPKIYDCGKIKYEFKIHLF